MHQAKRLKSAPLWALLALGLFSCSDPDIDPGQKLGERCTKQEDCASELACNVEDKKCVKAYNGYYGVYKDRIILGISGAQSGPLAALNQQLVTGMRTYFNHINTTSGGVFGRKIELKVYDDAYQIPKAVENAELMTNPFLREVFASIGNVGSPTVAAVVPLYNDRKVVLFGPYTGAKFTRPDPPQRYIFNVRVSYEEEALDLMNYLLNVREPGVAPENIGIFAQAEPGSTQTTWERLDEYGQAGFFGVSKALKQAKEIERNDVFVSSYERNSFNVDQALKDTIFWLADPKRVTDPGADTITSAILLQSIPNATAEFIIALKDELQALKANAPTTQGLSEEQLERLKRTNVVFVAISPASLGMEALLKSRETDTKKYCEGLIVSLPVPSVTSAATGVQNYKSQLAKFDPSAPASVVGFDGYITARIMVEALIQTGAHITDEAFVDALHSLDAVDVGIGEEISFTPNKHQALQKSWGSRLDTNCQLASFNLE